MSTIESLGQPVRRHVPDLVHLDAFGRRTVAALAAAGATAYLVGGCVRDALAGGANPKDVDLEVYGLGVDDLVQVLARLGHVDEVGRAFSVLKMSHGGVDYDIALPRTEVKDGTGHRGFTVVPDPYCDLATASARRDFTINALLWDPIGGDVIDPWGGLGDLEQGVLRHTSDAFGEDPLRVLRAVGFVARFGFTVHPDTLAVCRSLAGQFVTLSTERVWAEWRKVVTRGVHISAAIDVLEQTGWLEHFEELAALRGVRQDPHWHPEGDVLTHVALAGDVAARVADQGGVQGDDRAVVVLGALLHDVGKVSTTEHVIGADGAVHITSLGHDRAGQGPARRFMSRIGAPKHLSDRVVPLVAEHMTATTVARPTASIVRRLSRRLSPATMAEWAIVTTADKAGRGPDSKVPDLERWLQVAAETGAERGPVARILRGEHLIAAGMVPGPVFSTVLAASLAAQDDGEFCDEQTAKEWLARHLRERATHSS